jgi:hypothetical protein
MKPIFKKALCLITGHSFKLESSFFLPARHCTRCGLRQIRLPPLGCSRSGWTNAKTPYPKGE